MLIGASLFFNLLCVGQIKLSAELSMVHKTRIGLVLTGATHHSWIALPKLISQQIRKSEAAVALVKMLKLI